MITIYAAYNYPPFLQGIVRDLRPLWAVEELGLPHEIAHGSIRFSFSKYNTDEDVDKVLEVLPPAVEKLRKMSPMWNERDKK